jgi:hypothetical protein
VSRYFRRLPSDIPGRSRYASHFRLKGMRQSSLYPIRLSNVCPLTRYCTVTDLESKDAALIKVPSMTSVTSWKIAFEVPWHKRKWEWKLNGQGRFASSLEPLSDVLSKASLRFLELVVSLRREEDPPGEFCDLGKLLKPLDYIRTVKNVIIRDATPAEALDWVCLPPEERAEDRFGSHFST